MKFIHIADVHLGANPESSNEWGVDRGKEIWDSFHRIIKRVAKEKADMLLISGDLFHRQPLYGELKEINYLFSKIPDTTVVIIAGNHDYIRDDKAYYITFPWADNVIGLWNKEVECVHIPHLNTYVYGMSYHGREIRKPIYDDVTPTVQETKAYHILLAHGGDEKHIPITKETFATTKFDYVALGHIHKPQRLKPANVIYSGSLEPLDKNEKGSRGFILGEFTGLTLNCNFVPFARRRYLNLELQLKGDEGSLQVKDMIIKQIMEYGGENLYQICLEGICDSHLSIDLEDFYSLGNIVDIVDHSKPNYDLQELKQRYKGSLIERYITHFENIEDSIEREKALFYGLSALLEVKE